MKKLRKIYPTPVQVIGEGALRILSCYNRGKVLACVSGAIYLADQHDEIFWLIPPGGMMHPRGIQVEELFHWLKAGMSFTVVNHTLVINSSNYLDFSQSLVWESPRPAEVMRANLKIMFDSLVEMIDKLLNTEAPTGFGCLIKSLLQISLMDGEITEEKNISGVPGKAWPSIQRIIRATTIGDTLLWKKCANSLVGLGDGLTPSGDDFIGGFIFASRLLSHSYPVELRIPDSTCFDLIDQAKSLTNLISFTILKDHACGYSLEALYKLANGMLQNEPISQLYFYAKQLISVGHSTGWDILSGFIAGMAANLIIYSA